MTTSKIKFIGALPNQLSELFKENFADSVLLGKRELLYTYEPTSPVREQQYYIWHFQTPDANTLFMCESQKQFQEIVLQLQLGIPIEELIHD